MSVKLNEKQTKIRHQFRVVYKARYGHVPISEVEGLAVAIIVGEIVPVRDDPETYPMREIVPCLREAVSQVVDGRRESNSEWRIANSE